MTDVITKAELARELDLSRARISQLCGMGLPVRPDGKVNRAGSGGMGEGERLFMARRLVGEPSAEGRAAGADAGGFDAGRHGPCGPP